MKYFIWFLLILWILTITDIVAEELPATDLKVISSEEIQNAGITRIADILFLVDGWNLSTIDGYTWQVSANNLSSYQAQNWIVMLDGQRFELNSFDCKILNFLPVTIQQIDYVEIICTPGIHNGEFTEKGLIHFHTKKTQPNFLIQVFQMGGNVTGEPGPYEGTEYGTPDLQRIGRDASYSFDYGLKNWYFRTYFIRHFHPFQDIAMIKRNTKILEDPPGNGSRENRHLKLWFEDTDRPKMIRNSLSLRLGNKSIDNELQVDYSYSYRYFLFFKPIGREIPVNDIYTRIGLSGNLFKNKNILYRFQYFYKELEKHPNSLDFDFNWKSHNFSGLLEKKSKSLLFESRYGIEYSKFLLDTKYHLGKNYFDMAKLYGKVVYDLSEKVYQNLDGMICYSNDKTALKGSISNYWKINSSHSLNAVLSYSQRLFEEDNSLWFWIDRGYNILQEYDVDYTIYGKIEKSDQLTFDLTWNTELGNYLLIKLAGSYRNFNDLYIERQDFELNSQDYSFSAPVKIYTGQNGNVLGQQIIFNYRIIPQIEQFLSYNHQVVVAGDKVFREVWENIPEHKAVYKVTFTPELNFSLWARLTYLSSSYWIDYQGIDGQTYYSSSEINEEYHSTIDSSVILDFQIQKWFWERRLKASLLLRNVGNQELKYHPIGASFDLTYYFLLELYLKF